MQYVKPNDRFLAIEEVQNRIPFSRVHIYRLMKQGIFPTQYPIGPRRVAWLESDIDAFIEEKVHGVINDNG